MEDERCGPPLFGSNEGDETSYGALSIAAIEGSFGRVRLILLLLSVGVILALPNAGDVFSDPGAWSRMPPFISPVDGGVGVLELQAEAAMLGVEYASVVAGLKGAEMPPSSLSGLLDQWFPGK
jgi:hypothetical protein